MQILPEQAPVKVNLSSKLKLYRCQKHAARVVYHKDLYTNASPLLNDMKALNVFQ